MPFVPPSSLASFSGPIVVSGTVALDAPTLAALETISVDNFPADQLVHFTQPVTVDVDNFPATQAVTGPMTDAEFAAHLPLPVSASIDTSDLATEDTLERVAASLDDVALTAILEREAVK